MLARLLAVLFTVTLLAGCDVHSKNPASGDDNVSIHADENGRIAFNLPIGNGKVNIPTSMMHKGDFDIDGKTTVLSAMINAAGFRPEPVRQVRHSDWLRSSAKDGSEKKAPTEAAAQAL